jgi:5'-methylthioadenosine phosphorylase
VPVAAASPEAYNPGMTLAEIGIIGGSGFYHLPLEDERRLTLQTPYGAASDSVSLGTLGGRRVAFLPRHGREHQHPPHKVPYRANLYGLKELGVSQVIGCAAVGALSSEYPVGSFALADQLVDWTHGTRVDTYYDGPLTTHIDVSEPYCPAMRAAAVKAAAAGGLRLNPAATLVCTAGPRFCTRAESQFFARQGWHLENMTQYPEAVLARELNLSYLNVSLVTNAHDGAPAAAEQGIAATVIGALEQLLPPLRELLAAIVPELPADEDRPVFIRQALQRGRWV